MTLVEKRVPRSVLEAYYERLAEAEDPPADAVRRVHAEMQLQPRFGVPLVDLQAHLRVLRKRAERKPAVLVAMEGVSDVSAERRESWRTRLACASEIAHGLCEQMAAADEGRIQRAARLIIISRIFDALTQDEGELPTTELAALTRAYVAQRKAADADAAAASPQDRVKDEAALRTAVRQVYGVSMPEEVGMSPSDDGPPGDR